MKGPRGHRRSAAVLTFALLAAAGTFLRVDAQSPEPRRLDLRTAVERALATDPQIKTADAARRIAVEKIAEARSGRLPTVQFGQSVTRSNNPVFVFGSLLEQGRFTASNFGLEALNHPNGLTNFRTSVDVRVPVFDQWKTRSRVARADIERKQAELRTESTAQKLRFDVIRAYYGAILADEQLAATEAAVRSAEENSRNTRNMVKVGMVAESDSLVADVQLASIKQQQLEAESSAFTTRAALNIAIGADAGRVDELSGSLTERFFPVEEQSELISIAMERRPERRQADLAIDESREQTRSVKAEKLPRVDAFGSFGYSSPYLVNGSSDYAAGVNLSYTLFDPGRRSRIAQSAIAESSAESEKERLNDQIILEVITALQNYKTSRSKIHVSIKSVAQAEEALRILQDRYHAALSTFEAVLAAEAAVLRAKHGLLRARYEYYISYASILLATGRLTDVGVFD